MSFVLDRRPKSDALCDATPSCVPDLLDQLVCSACQFPLTVKHFLIECVNFAAIHTRYFSASSIKYVFENVNAQSVVDFRKEIIKEMNLYHEL